MENYSIRVENVFKHFEQKGSSSGMGGFGKKKKVKAVDGISMCVKPGEIIGIIGESGCGKSTLGKLLIKLEDTSSGQIFVDGKEINKFYKEDKLKFRRGSGDPKNGGIRQIKSLLEQDLSNLWNMRVALA